MNQQFNPEELKQMAAKAKPVFKPDENIIPIMEAVDKAVEDQSLKSLNGHQTEIVTVVLLMRIAKTLETKDASKE